jgi:hypothetical protein
MSLDQPYDKFVFVQIIRGERNRKINVIQINCHNHLKEALSSKTDGILQAKCKRKCFSQAKS